MSGLARKTGTVVLGRLLTTLVDLTTAVAIVRLLDKTEFAAISYVLIVYQTARYLATLGFPDSIFYFFERIAQNARTAFILQTVTLMASTGFLAASIVLSMQWWAPALLSSEWTPGQIQLVSELFPFLALAAVLEIPTWAVSNIFLALDRQKDAAIYELATSVLSCIGLVGPLLLGLSIHSAVFGVVVYAVIRFIASAVWLRLILPRSIGRLEPSNWREQVRFSAVLGLSALVSRFNKSADKLIVASVLPAFALAEYSVGAQEIPLINVIPFAVGSVLMSRLVRLAMHQKSADYLELWHRSIGKTSLIVLPLAVFFIVTAPDFIRTVFGPGYEGAVVPFQLYTLITLQRVTSYGGILQSFGNTRGVLKLTVMLLVANVAMSIPLTIMLGVAGTATGTLLANILSWILAMKMIAGHLKVRLAESFPFRYYGRVAASAFASGVIVWLIGSSLTEMHYGLRWTISAVLYLLLLSVFGTLTGLIGRTEWYVLAKPFRSVNKKPSVDSL